MRLETETNPCQRAGMSLEGYGIPACSPSAGHPMAVQGFGVPRPWHVACFVVLIPALLVGGCERGVETSTRSAASSAALRASLLQDEDLPASYAFTKEQTLLSIPGMCSSHDPTYAAGIARSLVREYQASPTGPILASFVLVFDAEKSASDAMASIAKAGVNCETFVDTGGCNARLETLRSDDSVVSYRSVAVCEPSKTETIAHLAFLLDGRRVGVLMNDFTGFAESPATAREQLITTFERRFLKR